MPDTLQIPLVETIAEALETMAFVAPMPADNPAMPDRPLLIRIGFTGPISGHLELIAPEALGQGIAANILGCDPTDDLARAQARDSLKELLNVTCGLMLAKLTTPGGPRFEMSVPTLVDPAPCTDIDPDHDTVLDADGHLIVVRVCEGQ